jgi:hypothetical protein
MSIRKKNKGKASKSQLLSFMPDSYLDRTSRPIYALAYLLIFIVFYEIGTIIISADLLDQSIARPQIRVVSFIWLQNMLEYIGFSRQMVWIATPLAVVLILLGLQITSRTQWKVRVTDFAPMTIECILLAIPLIVLSLSLNRSLNGQTSIEANAPPVQVCASVSAPAADVDNGQTITTLQNGTARPHNTWVNIVTGIGAGIYEELIFRLILICVLMIIFQDLLNLNKSASIITSILISAAFFSLHHYKFFLNGSIQTGEAFSMLTFSFRLLAGIYFAVVFAVRGFGIVAGTHAFYDIIAAILNSVFYTPSE